MEPFKIVALGDATESKTTLVTQFCLNNFIKGYAPPIEDTYQKQVVVDDKSYDVEIKDSNGQDEHRVLLDQSIRDADAFLLVYSTTSRETFIGIERHYNRIISINKYSCSRRSLINTGLSLTSILKRPSASVPMVIVGDNFDKVDKREVSRDEGIRLAERLGCKFLEASTKTLSNVELCFYTLIRMIRENRERGGGMGRDDERMNGETDGYENEQDRELKKKGKMLRNVICCGD